MPKYKIRSEPTMSMVETEIRVPYWYKQHEVQDPRHKNYPDVTTRNTMMYYNLKSNAGEVKKELQDDYEKMEKIAMQINGDFYRPKPVVFDASGKFHRTRVDEQSWL